MNLSYLIRTSRLLRLDNLWTLTSHSIFPIIIMLILLHVLKNNHKYPSQTSSVFHAHNLKYGQLQDINKKGYVNWTWEISFRVTNQIQVRRYRIINHIVQTWTRGIIYPFTNQTQVCQLNLGNFFRVTNQKQVCQLNMPVGNNYTGGSLTRNRYVNWTWGILSKSPTGNRYVNWPWGNHYLGVQYLFKFTNWKQVCQLNLGIIIWGISIH